MFPLEVDSIHEEDHRYLNVIEDLQVDAFATPFWKESDGAIILTGECTNS